MKKLLGFVAGIVMQIVCQDDKKTDKYQKNIYYAKNSISYKIDGKPLVGCRADVQVRRTAPGFMNFNRFSATFLNQLILKGFFI